MKNMYYYKQNGEFLEKYKIEFNVDELQKLRTEILNECSYITHEEKEYSYNPSQVYYEGYIRNIKDLGKTREKDLGSGGSLIYHLYSYDLYKPPILIDLIDRLIKGETQVIEDIDNPVASEKKFDFEECIATESKKVDAISNLDVDKKIAALKILNETIQDAKLNEKQKSTLDYYPLVQALIKRKLVATISLNEILKVTEFFEKGIDVLDLQYVENKHDIKRVRYLPNKK